MPLPFPTSTVRDKVFANVRELESGGLERNAAIAQAFALARAVCLKRNPQGLLPPYLAYHGKRQRRDYLDSGEPIKSNPDSAALARARKLQNDFAGDPPGYEREIVRQNVARAPFPVGFIVGNVLALDLETDDGARCWRLKFVEDDDRPALAVSDTGRKVAFIGGDWSGARSVSHRFDKLKISRIIYETVRDGQHINYQHPFRATVRPHLQLLDGRNACMIGGSFRFTDRGFVDRK